MEVSISLLPICHCQVSPTVGCHQDEAGCELELVVRVEDISVGVAFETGSICGESEAGLHPKKEEAQEILKPHDV